MQSRSNWELQKESRSILRITLHHQSFVLNDLERTKIKFIACRQNTSRWCLFRYNLVCSMCRRILGEFGKRNKLSNGEKSKNRCQECSGCAFLSFQRDWGIISELKFILLRYKQKSAANEPRTRRDLRNVCSIDICVCHKSQHMGCSYRNKHIKGIKIHTIWLWRLTNKVLKQNHRKNASVYV